MKNTWKRIKKQRKTSITLRYYSDYLIDKCKNLFYIHPTNKDEITNIISSLDKYKSIGPYSVPNNILILLENEMSNSLADIFVFSFSSGIFPLPLLLR